MVESSNHFAFCSTPVLPPIITNEKDRLLVAELSDWARHETQQQDTQQCFAVYKEVFSRIIDNVTEYRPTMIEIKAQYEEVIDTLLQEKRDVMSLKSKLSQRVNAPSTLKNYKKRAEELENRLSIIEKDNLRLQEQCIAVQNVREEWEMTSKSVIRELEDEEKQQTSYCKPIPGLTVQQSTDVATLECELEKLDHEFRKLSASSRTRYLPKEHLHQLKEESAIKVTERDLLEADVEQLRQRDSLMCIAAETAHTYLKTELPYQTIGNAILTALNRVQTKVYDHHNVAEADSASLAHSHVFDEGDEKYYHDSLVMLDYNEQFDELMADQRYREAALHAANSPRGFLRTQEIMQRFAGLPARCRSLNEDGTEESPLLTFCSALLTTVSDVKTKPDELISRRCVQCALDENRKDLVAHWLSLNRLELSESLGDLIGHHTSCANSNDLCLAMAQKIYTEIGSHVSAMVCMAKRGCTGTALGYADEHGCKMDDLIQALLRCPSYAFASALYSKQGSLGHRLLPLGVILTTLLQTDSYINGLDLIEAIYDASENPGLQHEYTSQTGRYKLLKNLLALPMLPAEHILPAFHALTIDIIDETTLKLVNYVRTTWLENVTWSVTDVSVFKPTIRTNTDLEGWHRRLNVRARRGHLPLYMLVKLLHTEAHNAGLQVILLSEGKIKRHTRRKYKEINERLNDIWARYEAGAVTTTRLLRYAARLQLPFS